LPTGESPGFPESSLPRRRLMDFRVSSDLAPSGDPGRKLLLFGKGGQGGFSFKWPPQNETRSVYTPSK